MDASTFVFKIKADFLGSLAHPMRLRIIEALKKRERSVSELVAELQVPQPSVSKHLAILRQAGIVETQQRGKAVFYRIGDTGIFGILRPVTVFLKKQMKRSQKMLDQLA